MNLKADRATLLKALAHVQSVVERRNTIPILANVMLSVRDGRLTLTATDMEIAIVEDVPAATTRNGACTAPAATLYEIVRKLPDGAEVELDHPAFQRNPQHEFFLFLQFVDPPAFCDEEQPTADLGMTRIQFRGTEAARLQEFDHLRCVLLTRR